MYKTCLYICGMSSICLGDKSPRHMDGKVKDNSANVKQKPPHIYIYRKVKKKLNHLIIMGGKKN